MKYISLIFIFSAFFMAMSSSLSAKIKAPEPVAPVYTSTLRIEAPLNGTHPTICVYDRADGRLLWSVVVCEIKIDPHLEEDVQWRFISQMKLAGDAVEVTVGRAERYRVSLTTRKVEPIAAAILQ